MALKKEIIKESGIQTSYHKISSINLNVNSEDTNRLVVMVESFLNEEYREKNYPVLSDSYVFTLESNEDETVGIRTLGYQKLKELEIFADAEDC